MLDVIEYAPLMARAALAPRLAVPVSTKVPNPRPRLFVTLKQAGPAHTVRGICGSRSFVVSCCGADELAAGRLAERCVAILSDPETWEGTSVRAATVYGGPSEVPDPDVPGETRLQLAVSLVMRAEPAE